MSRSEWWDIPTFKPIYLMSSFRPNPSPAWGFFYGFNDLMAGFDYRTYKEMPQGHDAKNVEPIRVHHRDCFLKSYSANDFGSSAKNFAVESHHVVQFLGVRKMSWAREIAVMDFVGFDTWQIMNHVLCMA